MLTWEKVEFNRNINNMVIIVDGFIRLELCTKVSIKSRQIDIIILTIYDKDLKINKKGGSKTESPIISGIKNAIP